MDSVNLLFTGDFAPLTAPDQISHDHFKDLNNILSSADLHITNLECPLTRAENAIRKTGPSIKGYPEAIELLKQAKVGIACLANNHIFDYGEDGINDTIDLCEGNGIGTIGIISRKDKRDHWIIKELKGKKIGFLNYCEHEFSVREEGSLGASGYDPLNAFYDISGLRPEVDCLIVIYHGGNEYYPLPRPDLKKDFHYLADLGADAVIGHHTHVVSGYEIYDNKPLVYSLGNFFFPSKGEPDPWYSGVMCLLKIGEKLKFELIHIKQCRNNFRVELQVPEHKELNEKGIQELSGIISDDEKLKRSWESYVSNFGPGLEGSFLYPSVFDRILKKLKLKIYNDHKLRAIINIISNSSLRKLLIDSLKLKNR
ncbi:MAG TPA: CapA family protein [Bacteroidales bacterium]|nr:hypothetical protein [Bacteroidales bacterium]HNR40734.1 CapA family protein [Bacteroidales bacterium]